jgi:hypothetical protein
VIPASVNDIKTTKAAQTHPTSRRKIVEILMSTVDLTVGAYHTDSSLLSSVVPCGRDLTVEEGAEPGVAGAADECCRAG